MTQFFMFTDDYPLTTSIKSLLASRNDEIVLVTRCPDTVISSFDRESIAQIVEVKDFSDSCALIETIERCVAVQPGATAVSHDDFIYAAVADVVEHFGMRGMSWLGVEPFVDKDAAKRLLRRDGIRFPAYYLLDCRTGGVTKPGLEQSVLLEDLSFPVFVKPTRGAGAENARKFISHQEVEEWLSLNSFSQIFEIDEFIGDARLFHCELLVQGNQIDPFQVCEYSHPCADFSSGKAVGSYTLDMEKDVRASAIASFSRLCLSSMARQVTLPSGMVHLEVFYRDSGEIIFVEAQLRPPGANARKLYIWRYSLDAEATHFHLQMGRTVPHPSPSGPFTAWIYFPTKDGVVSEFRDLPRINSRIVESDWKVVRGQRTRRPQSILDAVGRNSVALSVVICNDDIVDLREDFLRLVDFDCYSVS